MASDLTVIASTKPTTCDRYFTRRGAAVLALNVFAIATAGMLYLVWLDKHKKRAADRRAGCLAWTSAAAFAILGVGTYLALPKVDAEITRFSWLRLPGQHESLAAHLREKASYRSISTRWAREEIAAARAGGLFGGTDAAFWINRLTGEPLCEESSPGNYTLRVREGKVEYVWFDGLGGENVIEVGTATDEGESRPAHHQ